MGSATAGRQVRAAAAVGPVGLVGLVGLVAGVLALSGCGQQEGAALGAAPSSTVTASGPGAGPRPADAGGREESAVPEQATELAARVDQIGRAHPEAYAGLVLDGDRVRVHRVPSARLDAALRALPEAERLDLRDAPYAARELERLRDRVVADADELRAQGVALASVGARPDGTAVDVLAPDADRARAVLTERYGVQAPLAVVRGGPVVPLSRGTGPR